MSFAEDLRERSDSRLAAAQLFLDKLLEVRVPRTAENTLQPYSEIWLLLCNGFGEAHAFSALHPDPEARGAAEQSLRQLVDFSTRISMDVRLHDALAALDLEALEPDARHL